MFIKMYPWEFLKTYEKTFASESIFDVVADFQPATLLKKRPDTDVFLYFLRGL